MIEEIKSNGVEEKTVVARVILEYNTEKGSFSMYINWHDEVLTTGMLELAKKKLSERYSMLEMVKHKEASENGIGLPAGIKVQ